ncbi:MAG TPA: hypothetical protein VGK67_01230 [Myxococcales bacterium]|jgi:hypothetical protein
MNLPLPPRRALLPLAAAALALAGSCACRGSVAGPAPEWLPKVPEGYGRPFRSGAVLRVQERRLVLPSGQTCLGPESACTKALEELRGKDLVLELDEKLKMADLSAALSAVSEALERGDQACLEAFDGKERRCIPFRPFSGDDFGAWLDADKPLGKIRIVMRTDGLEVVTDRGKIPGPDRYGPSLPSPGARPDYPGIEDAAAKLKARFRDEDTAGLVPSASIPVAQAVRVLSSLSGPQGERFEKTFLVYP